jgi:hypothetical protein
MPAQILRVLSQKDEEILRVQGSTAARAARAATDGWIGAQTGNRRPRCAGTVSIVPVHPFPDTRSLFPSHVHVGPTWWSRWKQQYWTTGPTERVGPLWLD